MKILKILSLASAGVILGGCVEYEIETTLNADGSGIRREAMSAMEDEGVDMAPEEFAALMYVGPEHGWSHREETDSDGDTSHLFERRTELQGLESWSDLSDGIRIAGSADFRGPATYGSVTLGDIQFRNRVRVGRGSVSDGTTSFTFQETFAWEQAVDALAEYLMVNLGSSLASQYPLLSDQQRGEIIGFARARFWIAVEDGYLDDSDNDDELEETGIRKTVEHAMPIIRLCYPDADEEELTEVLESFYRGEGEELEMFISETVPGLNIAINSEIIFRLNMPGRVTNSNADRTEGNTLVWEFGPLDAINTPVEIYAESVVRQ